MKRTLRVDWVNGMREKVPIFTVTRPELPEAKRLIRFMRRRWGGARSAEKGMEHYAGALSQIS